MSKKILIIAIAVGLIILATVLFRFLPSPEVTLDDLGELPDNPASQVCLNISEAGDVYHCLAVVNKDVSYCAKMNRGEDKDICLALASEDISFCRKIKMLEAKEVCYYTLNLAVDRIDYCDELDNSDKCYFSFVHRLYWQDRADEIKAEYCQKLAADPESDLVYRNTCWALKANDSSLCQGNENCRSFFEQPLSFCKNNKLKNESDCLRDRALTAKDPSLCDQITDEYYRNNCYTSYSAHIGPDLALCEKVSDKMMRNSCYVEYAVNLSEGIE